MQGVTGEARGLRNTAPVQKITFWKALEMKPEGSGIPRLCRKTWPQEAPRRLILSMFVSVTDEARGLRNTTPVQKNLFWTALQIHQKGLQLMRLCRKTCVGELYRYTKKDCNSCACAEKHVLQGVTGEARGLRNTTPVQKITFWKALEMKPEGSGIPRLCRKTCFGQLYR